MLLTAIIFNLLALTLTIWGLNTGKFAELNPFTAEVIRKGIGWTLLIFINAYLIVALLYQSKKTTLVPATALTLWGGDLAWDIHTVTNT